MQILTAVTSKEWIYRSVKDVKGRIEQELDWGSSIFKGKAEPGARGAGGLRPG